MNSKLKSSVEQLIVGLTYKTGNGKFHVISFGQPNKKCVNGGIAFGRKKNKTV